MTTDTKAVARWDVQDVSEGMEHIRCAKYPDLIDYHHGVSGEGPHAYTWSDKPHRLVFDLTAKVAELRDEITDHEQVVGELQSSLAASRAEAIELDSAHDDALFENSKLRAEVEGLKKLLGETAQCLADVSNDVGGWAVEEVIESAMNAAMETGNV